MNCCSTNSTGTDFMQDGPISGDMNLALTALCELVHLLPDENIRTARKLLQNLFDCKNRVEGLERAAIIVPRTEKEACHV